MRKRLSLVAVLVLLGLGLRAYHYLRSPVVWHDEAALILNVLDRNYAELLGPLRFHEAAPPLFLWLEKIVSQTLGDEPLALRLPPFLASCVAMLLMVPIARRLLSERAVPWALLLFACSEQLLWHACEAKPYAFDVLAATVLLAVVLHQEGLGVVLTLLLLTALAPILIWLSYPACFLLGGVLVALVPSLRHAQNWRAWTLYGLLVVVVATAFLALVLGPARAQHDPTIHGEWTPCFPDWSRPWSVPLWLTASTLEVGRYACKPLGQGIMLLALAGAVRFWWQGQRVSLVLLVLPVGLALFASCLQRYPYGGVRVMVFAAPAVLLLASSMIPLLLDALKTRQRLVHAAFVCFLLLPAGVAVWRVLFPWPTADMKNAASYVVSRRRADDPVTGNDWTYLYYLREIGPAFHWPEDSSAQPTERLWVVFTALTSPEERLRHAANMAPQGWTVIDRHETDFTTTVLFVK